MATVSGILFFLFGAAIGSFLNVLIARYDPERSLFYFPALLGRSRCPHCKKTLGVFELIPIFSFIFLRAKCRGCKGGIRFRYPIVEILSGLLFVLVPLVLTKFYGFSLSSFFLFLSPLWLFALVGVWILALLAFLLIAFIDAEHYIIPDELNIFVIICGGFISWVLLQYGTLLQPFSEYFIRHYALLFSPPANPFLSHTIGFFVAGAFFLALVGLTRGRGMGMGDVKLMAAAGFLFGWPDIVLGIFFGFLIGGIASAFLYIRKKKGMKDMIPFGPFLVLGLCVLFFFGFRVIDFYFSILG